MNKEILEQQLFNQKYGRIIEEIKYWTTSILGGAIGAIAILVIFALILALQ